MSALVVLFPSQPVTASTEFEYVLTSDGSTPASHGAAQAALLPAPARAGFEVVAVVPAAMLSWHRVELPKGTTARSPRLRAVLEGLLEEQLLDEPESLHFALQPDTRSGGPLWVATCDRAWLRSAVHVLEAAGRPAASSTCTALRSHARSHVATQSGPPLRVSGCSAKCSDSGSSSNCSSSKPSSTARSRGDRAVVPLGNSTRCQDSMAAGTTATTSKPARAGAGSNAACAAPWLAGVLPSLVRTYSNSVDAVTGCEGNRTTRALMSRWIVGTSRR